jgi:hypothetical protein
MTDQAAPFRALLVEGKTYPVRRELRAFGGHFSREHEGHLCPFDKADAVRAFAAQHGFTVSELELDADPFAPLTPEQLRAWVRNLRNGRDQRLSSARFMRRHFGTQYASDVAECIRVAWLDHRALLGMFKLYPAETADLRR